MTKKMQVPAPLLYLQNNPLLSETPEGLLATYCADSLFATFHIIDEEENMRNMTLGIFDEKCKHHLKHNGYSNMEDILRRAEDNSRRIDSFLIYQGASGESPFTVLDVFFPAGRVSPPNLTSDILSHFGYSFPKYMEESILNAYNNT